MTDATCTCQEAVKRAQNLVGNGGQYLLGTGDYKPDHDPGGTTIDFPWTLKNNEAGSDCAGFAICWCWKLRRHRPGFNHGTWSTVEDDINVNSIMEDAQHKCELAETVVTVPVPGDLLCYPTFYLKGHPRPFIGHVGIIEAVPANYTVGRYDRLAVIQCHGPDHFKPGVVRTDGSIWLHHDMQWAPVKERQTKIVRMKERV